jgi:hypothetical protein
MPKRMRGLAGHIPCPSIKEKKGTKMAPSKNKTPQRVKDSREE